MSLNRFHRVAALTIGMLSITAAASCADESGPTARAAKAGSSSTAAARFETATFAGGCFWCLETAFEGVPGVISAVSGYAGGHKDKPRYEEVGAGGTGHTESVQIRFDPARIGYAQLLDRFWHSVDPTQANGQFCDRGDQYRSEIFWHDEMQRKLAEESKRGIEASGVLHQPIVTRITKAGTFYPAEEYHQDYWKKDPDRYRTYRAGCGRDQRLAELWGKSAVQPLVH